jgi:hypothetical protein
MMIQIKRKLMMVMIMSMLLGWEVWVKRAHELQVRQFGSLGSSPTSPYCPCIESDFSTEVKPYNVDKAEQENAESLHHFLFRIPGHLLGEECEKY